MVSRYTQSLSSVNRVYDRLDVTPKTTEQNRIVHTGKSEVKVTSNNKKLHSRYHTIEEMKLTTDRYQASCDIRATCSLKYGDFTIFKMVDVCHLEF